MTIKPAGMNDAQTIAQIIALSSNEDVAEMFGINRDNNPKHLPEIIRTGSCLTLHAAKITSFMMSLVGQLLVPLSRFSNYSMS